MRGVSRKRGLKFLSMVGKCHPGTRKKNGKCLPIKLKKAPQCGPDDEHCLLDNATLPEYKKQELRKKYLRPKYPSEWKDDPDMWLSNFDIEAVMRQYEEADKSFKFLGILPIDFSAPSPYVKDKLQCLHPEICTLNLKEEHAKGIRNIGIVFNLDPHNKGGSHWMGLFICLKDIKKPWVAYFDSYGYETPPMISRFMRSLKLQNPDIKLMYNARRFQYGGTECGMYSMYFIIMMLAGIPFRKFCRSPVPDGAMLELRKKLFTK